MISADGRKRLLTINALVASCGAFPVLLSNQRTGLAAVALAVQMILLVRLSASPLIKVPVWLMIGASMLVGAATYLLRAIGGDSLSKVSLAMQLLFILVVAIGALYVYVLMRRPLSNGPAP